MTVSRILVAAPLVALALLSARPASAGQAVAYINDYGNAEWQELANPPVDLTAIAGENGKGVVGLAGRKVCYCADYGNQSWKQCTPAPFRAQGLAGNVEKGPIVYGGDGGMQVAFTDNFAGGWHELPNAPFQIAAIAGDNRKGMAVLSAERTQILYI